MPKRQLMTGTIVIFSIRVAQDKYYNIWRVFSKREVFGMAGNHFLDMYKHTHIYMQTHFDFSLTGALKTKQLEANKY